MSTRAFVLLLAPLLWGPGAAAQTLARQRAVVDSLRARVAVFEARSAQLDSAVRAARRLDTLVIGGLTLVSDSTGSPRLRAAAESTWAVVSGELGATPAAFEGRKLFLRFSRPAMAWADLMRPGDQSADADPNDDALRQRLLASAGSIVAERAGRRVARWAGAGMSLHHNRERLRRRAFVEMVTAETPDGQACNAGDLAACAAALGIAGGGSFSSENASGVLRTAGRLGGTGAFDRLAADTALPLGRRLEAMAGLPLDTVLAVWWRDARGTARPRTRVPARTQWVTLAWTVVFAGLALRSTRWR